LYDRKLEKKELSMQETLDYANHLEQVFKTTKKCNDQIEAKRNFCSLNNANNEKPKNNENTCNIRNTKEAKQNYANNNQE
jgi:putative cell wall-binding protein